MRSILSGTRPFLISLFIIMILQFGVRCVLSFSSQKYIVSAYFEPQISTYTSILLLFTPVFLMYREKIKINLFVIYTMTFAIWFGCLYISKALRVNFSRFIGFPAAEESFIDLRTIPSFIQCPNATGCDPYGRITGYGNGFKLLFPLQSWTLTLVISLLSALYIIHHFSKLTINNKNFLFLMAISPSWIFVLERGNSTLIVMAFVVFVGGLSLKNEHTKAFLYLLLGSMKPFFFGALLGLKNLKILVITLPLSVLVYFVSLNFDFSIIKQARVSTIYYPSSQFGIDQLPAFFFQMISGRINQKVQPWEGSSIFIICQLLGLASLILTIFLFVKFEPELVQRTTRDASLLSDLSISCTGIYLVFYLSGSQVSYSAWIAFPFLCFMASHVFINNTKVFQIILLIYAVFATVGINNWFARSIGNQIIASFASIALYSIFKERFKSQISKMDSSHKNQLEE